MAAQKGKERTEIWEGIENISKKSWQVLSGARERSDYCHDSKSASFLVGNERYFQMIKQLQARGIKQRFVTEVTKENIQSCKELNKYVELRHMEGVKGNFGIVDGKEYGASANISDLQPSIQFIYSNIKSFVDQQQYLFETLWSKALPAQYKIKEIEEGIPIEKSEVIEGTEEVINKLIEGFYKIRETFDNCIDSSCASSYVSTTTVWDRCVELNQRGVKLRFIIEITKGNISYCKEIMKIAEVRHLDKVKGNFGIADKKDYRGVANMEEGKPPTQAIRSTVKSFVDQQQYFFETLWNKAIPAEKKIREIEEGIPAEVTEIWYGRENIIKKSWEIIYNSKVSSDYCHNSKTPSIFVTNPYYLRTMKELSERGVKHRFLTEIIKENIQYCKELAKYVELRHIDGVKGSFSIIDGKEYGADPNPSELQPPTEFIHSNVRKFVDQQQYFFETLWNKAIPAEKKIREIEEGIPAEVTEIWYGADNIVKKQLEIITKAQATVDYCHSSESPSIIATFKPFMLTIIQLNKRGVKQRYITKITEGNMRYCKELAKYVELRHLDHVEGTLGIIDGKIYGAIANTKQNHLPTEFIYSNVKSFIDQQQYFFETLWNKAIPAEQRTREIEEGLTPETVQTLNNHYEIQKLANKLVCSAKKELLIVFPTAAQFHHQQNDSNGFLKKLTSLQGKGIGFSKKGRGVGTLDLRITVPGNNANNNLNHFHNPLQKTGQETYPSIRIRSEIRYIDAALSTNVAVIIVDRKHSFVIEVKDDEPSGRGGVDYNPRSSNAVVKRGRNVIQKVPALAIYTNSKALVMSTVSMFELLWTHIELYEELKLRDIERREFIDIAAHELRGPIQPILGLAKEIRSRYDLGKDDKMLGAILRSAANLQTLANNILDIARIESKSLELKISRFDLNALARAAIDDLRLELLRKNAVKIRFKSNYKRLLIDADKERIYQVIYNLLANAIKFTDSGLISISASKKDQNEIIFSVRDTGQGIDEKIMRKLFSKFATSPAIYGTGLGLFISRKIIDAHSGNIYGINNNPADSNRKEGGGATFTFTLPLKGTKTIKSRNL
jgi:two-component system sensor histidine kinase VicK